MVKRWVNQSAAIQSGISPLPRTKQSRSVGVSPTMRSVWSHSEEMNRRWTQMNTDQEGFGTRPPIPNLCPLLRSGSRLASRYLMHRTEPATADDVQWRNFLQIVSKARTACEVSGNQALDHFVDVNKMIRIGAPDAGGISSCSRWLSAATPPDENPPVSRTPAGVPAKARHALHPHLPPTTGFRPGSRRDQNAKAVRQTLIDRGIRPESLLPDEDVKKRFPSSLKPDNF